MFVRLLVLSFHYLSAKSSSHFGFLFLVIFDMQNHGEYHMKTKHKNYASAIYIVFYRKYQKQKKSFHIGKLSCNLQE